MSPPGRLQTGAAPERVVIVGAGQAGGRCAEALRGAGHRGSITLVGQETHLPYERPSLSKEMLAEDQASIAWVRPEQAYADDDVTLKLGVRATAIDREAQALELDDGSSLGYDVLVLATGARPRLLTTPGAQDLPVLALRSIEDSVALRSHLVAGSRLVVVGAGFIGLEVAAAARQRGVEVSVVEAADRVMARAVPPQISAFHTDMHRSRGVSITLGTTIVSMTREDGALVLRGSNGEAFFGDLVVAGIGIEPADELARDAGLATDRGVVVDAFGATTDPRIFAAGDVARHYNPLLGAHILLESWQNAQNQAIAVARVIAGGATPYAEIPWFWSDQFGVNLQVAGLQDPEATAVLRGSPGDGPFVLLQVKSGRLVSACALDAARDLRVAKELMQLGAPVTTAVLADPKVRLGDVLRDFKQRKAAA